MSDYGHGPWPMLERNKHRITKPELTVTGPTMNTDSYMTSSAFRLSLLPSQSLSSSLASSLASVTIPCTMFTQDIKKDIMKKSRTTMTTTTTAKATATTRKETILTIPVRGSFEDGRLGTGPSSPDDDDDDDHSDPSSSPGSGAYHRPPSIDREDLVARVKDLESRLTHQTIDIGWYKLDVKGYKKDVRERDKEIAQQRATIEKQEAIIRELLYHRFRSQHQLLPPPASPITLDPNEDQVLLSHVPLGIDLGGAPMMMRPPGSPSRPTRSIPPSVPVAVSAEAGEASIYH